MVTNSPKIVSIGGGCGVAQVLLGLSQYTTALTGIIAVTDTGRSTGKVRTLANIPAPGDIRNALASLSTEQSFLPKLMQHRLQVPDFAALDGIAMGNLIMAAITQMTGSFAQAVELMQEMLGVKIQILPVTTYNTHLCAELVDGTIIEQEFNVRALNKPAIKRVFIQNPEAQAYEARIKGLLIADLITIGPGSLFTTVLACLAFDELAHGLPDDVVHNVAGGVIDAARLLDLWLLLDLGPMGGSQANDLAHELLVHLAQDLDRQH